MIEPLDNRDTNLPEAEQSSLLSSNMEVMDCSALGFNQEPPVEVLLEQLAELIVEAYFYEQQHKTD